LKTDVLKFKNILKSKFGMIFKFFKTLTSFFFLETRAERPVTSRRSTHPTPFDRVATFKKCRVGVPSTRDWKSDIFSFFFTIFGCVAPVVLSKKSIAGSFLKKSIWAHAKAKEKRRHHPNLVRSEIQLRAF